MSLAVAPWQAELAGPLEQYVLKERALDVGKPQVRRVDEHHAVGDLGGGRLVRHPHAVRADYRHCYACAMEAPSDASMG